MFPIAIMIVWLNSQGGIEAQATGAAVDVASCEKIAEKNIADQAENPELKGLTPKFSCWDTAPAPEHKTAPAAKAKPKTSDV
jgi:hypothetical protein